MKRQKLSIIVPVYNEARTIAKVYTALNKIKLKWRKEIIWVDDGSRDGSKQWLNKVHGHKFLFHKQNMGKGAAVRSGLAVATGDFVVIFDADGEMEAGDIARLINKAEEGYPVVFGTRNKGETRALYWYFSWGVKMLAGMINVLYGQHISDPEMGMKLIRRDIINFEIGERGFGQEIEWTCKLARQGIKIAEVPVSYYPRTFAQGKKITWKDGVRAVWLVIKFKFE